MRRAVKHPQVAPMGPGCERRRDVRWACGAKWREALDRGGRGRL